MSNAICLLSWQDEFAFLLVPSLHNSETFFNSFSSAHLKCFPNKYTYNALKRYEIFDDCRKCLLKIPDGNVNGFNLSSEMQYVQVFTTLYAFQLLISKVFKRLERNFTLREFLLFKKLIFLIKNFRSKCFLHIYNV